jgi:hypothetical protein
MYRYAGYKKELRGYRYLLAESDCACLEKRDIRMRKMMGSSWNRAENPPYTHIFASIKILKKCTALFCSPKKNNIMKRSDQGHLHPLLEHLETHVSAGK